MRERVELGEDRHLLRWSHISENHSLIGAHGIGALAEAVAAEIGCGLGAGGDQRSVAAKVPAVIAAHDAVLLHDPVFERGAAMGAGLVQEADLAAAISKYNKILTQQPQRDRQVLKLRLDHDRMPVAPQILATGGARPDLGQRTRLERRWPVVISAVAAGAALPRLVVHRMIPP